MIDRDISVYFTNINLTFQQFSRYFEFFLVK